MGLDLVRTYKGGRIEKGFYYMYLKFSNNGIAFYSNDTKEPFNQINIYDIGGQYCYYKITGDEVRLELYDSHLKKFTIMYIHLYSDKLIIYKDILRIWWGGKQKDNYVYNKSRLAYKKPLLWPK